MVPPLSDSDEFSDASGRSLAGEILDLYTGGAFSFWRWTPTTDSLVTHGSLFGESLNEWLLRIHPRDQAAFSQFLDQDWQKAPPLVSIDYRFHAHRHGDWVRLRHTAGLSGSEGKAVVSGLVEIVSPSARSRTLLKRVEDEMLEGESRLREFLNGLFATCSSPDPEPLLELLRKTLRADTVALVNLDTRHDITDLRSPAGGGSAFRVRDIEAPLRQALGHWNGVSSSGVFELDLDPARADHPWAAAKTVVMPNGSVAAVLCAGFRTIRGRSDAHRFYSALSLASSVTASQVHRHREARHRRDLLTQLRQAQRLSSIGRLTGGFAHDLNNLLTVVQGHLHLLDKALDCRDWEAVVEPLAQLRQSAEQATEFSERLLLFGAPRPMEPKVCDLNRLVERFATMMRHILEENVEIHLDLDSSIASVRADEPMLREALMHLVVNARDSMNEGGVVTIQTSSATRLSTKDGGVPEYFVRLSISDDGSNSHSDHLPTLWESLDLQEIDTKESKLDLFHVASIIAEHGGRVESCGDPTKANRLHLLFPANEAKPETRIPQPGTQCSSASLIETRLHGLTILLVEDENAVRKLVRKLLEVLGCSVIEAISGREALDLWPKVRDQVSLVVSDIVMPDGVSGWDLARDLHHRHPNLAILLTSGYGELPQDHGLGGIPQIGFLQKPYGVNTLREQLAALASPALAS